MRKQGYIRKRGANSWRVTVDLGRDPVSGKRRQSSRTIRGSEQDARRELRSMLTDLDRGTFADPGRVTVADYLNDKWLPHARTRIRSSTWNRYDGLVRIHVVPSIGRLPLVKLRPVHVQGVVDGMIAGGSAPRTVIQAYRVLSAALRQAVRWQLLAVNPAAAVSPPRAERPRLNIPDAATIATILERARGTTLEGPVTLAVSTGMRLGEVLGLRWRDVDLDAGLLRVTTALQWEDGRGFDFVQPKTPRARRTIAIPPFAVEALRRYRKEQAARRLLAGEGWQDFDLVLDRGDGGPLRTDAISGGFADMIRDAGLPHVRFHDLRHAYATALLAGGVHPKIASEALGHASVAFTMDVYSHVVPSMQQAAADAIQAALGAVVG